MASREVLPVPRRADQLQLTCPRCETRQSLPCDRAYLDLAGGEIHSALLARLVVVECVNVECRAYLKLTPLRDS